MRTSQRIKDSSLPNTDQGLCSLKVWMRTSAPQTAQHGAEGRERHQFVKDTPAYGCLLLLLSLWLITSLWRRGRSPKRSPMQQGRFPLVSRRLQSWRHGRFSCYDPGLWGTWIGASLIYEEQDLQQHPVIQSEPPRDHASNGLSAERLRTETGRAAEAPHASRAGGLPGLGRARGSAGREFYVCSLVFSSRSSIIKFNNNNNNNGSLEGGERVPREASGEAEARMSSDENKLLLY